MPSLLGSEEHTSELQSPCNLVCRLCLDRKSTRLNSSHLVISYAVFCLKKKKNVTIKGGGEAIPAHLRRGAHHTDSVVSSDKNSTSSSVLVHPSCLCVFVFFFF